jgi:aerobic-type carbon monoxide dehydrogenase small subunit (CoxS/CutS family)
VLTTRALLNEKPNPTDDEMRSAFQSLVCRCGSHTGVFAAVRRAVDDIKKGA